MKKKSKHFSWCATSTDSNSAYLTYAYCGYGGCSVLPQSPVLHFVCSGNNNGDTCVPMLYNGEMVYCTEDSTSGWCATSGKIAKYN